jgi:hypothetical protein
MDSSLPGHLIDEMLEDFRAKGTFGEFGNFLAGKDEYFKLGDWWRVVRTVPSLRRYMPLALLWNLVAKKRERTGYSERFIPGRKWNFTYRSFATDFLVWESLVRAAGHSGAGLPAWVSEALTRYVALTFANQYEIEYQGRILPMFSYYPRRDHMVDPGNEVHRLFFSRDDNVPDIDTTCILLGAWITLRDAGALPPEAYPHGEAETRDLLDLMADHLYGRGKYGQGELSYLNGIRPDDPAMLTWVFDEHNEIDPTSNVNMLNWLFLIGRVYPGLPEDRIVLLTRSILRFLANHAEDGTLLDQRFQSYYPLGPSLHLWDRLMRTWRTLDPGLQARFDPDGAMPRIHAFMLSEAERLFIAPPRPYHDYDFLLAAPLLYEGGVLREKIRAWLGDGRALAEHFRQNQYEVLHLRYPSKIICAPLRIPFACLLDLSTLVEKIPR